MTNEFVFGYTFIGFPNVFADPSKVDRTQVGYGYKGLFKNGVAQIPSFGGNGCSEEAALIFNPGGFEAGGPSAGLYADKWMPSFSDTVTKVLATHTVKAGVFWEWIRNSQPANNNTNGNLNVNVSNPNTTGNEYADLLTGTLNGTTKRPSIASTTLRTALTKVLCRTLEGQPQVDRGTWNPPDALHAMGGPDRGRLFHLRLLTVQIHLRPLQYCGFPGTSAIQMFQSEAS